MRRGVLQALLDALDGHTTLMRALVGLAQREQQHLIAFEPTALAACTEEKRVLADRLADSERLVRGALADAAADAGLAAPGEATVRALAAALDGPTARFVEDRANNLRALGESLRELQAMSLVQAERGLRLVEAYASLLRAADAETADPGTYTARGRSAPGASPGGSLSRTL